jgi:hypothetical protein
MGEEEVTFIDADTALNSSQGSSFKEIIMIHLGRIGTICTKEFRRGYWEKRPVKVGDAVHIVETYKEDTRDAYINAVDFFYDMMLPKLNDDDKGIVKIKEEIDKINQKMNQESSSIKDEEAWKSKRLEYRRLIFQQLSLLMAELRYFEQQYMD